MNRRILYFLSLTVLIATALFGQQKASDQGVTTGTVIPAGVIMPYAGATAPAGWVFAYGQEVSQISATYKKLYAAVGTTYCTVDHGTANEAGAGSNLAICGGGFFRIPDMRGRDARGKDNMGGVTKGRVSVAGGTFDGTSLGKSGGAQAQASNVTIDAHSITQPAINSHTLTATNIPVVTGSSSVSGSRDQFNLTGGGSHGHSLSNSRGGVLYVMYDYLGGSTVNAFQTVGGTVNGSQIDNFFVFTSVAESTHSHSWTGSFSASGSASVGTAPGSLAAVTHSMSNVGVQNHNLGNAAVNNLTPTVITNYIIKL